MTGWTEEGIFRSWRALANRQEEEDWRLVNLVEIGPISIKAGCHFPGSMESIVIGFPQGWLGKTTSLPNGKGFEASLIERHEAFGGKDVVAVIRRPAGDLGIFAIMTVDLLHCVEDSQAKAPKILVASFLERVREWQAFMARGQSPLSPEAQAGLYGELTALEAFINRIPPEKAFESWKGPLRAAQDFQVGSGACEIKSTASTDGFKARINSIEQLDSDLQPMFLCGIRLREQTDGLSLNMLVAKLREIADQSGKGRSFEALLIMSGYIDEHADHYDRPLSVDEFRVYRVDDAFPALRRAELPASITNAAYTLDLGSIANTNLGLEGLFEGLGISV